MSHPKINPLQDKLNWSRFPAALNLKCSVLHSCDVVKPFHYSNTLLSLLFLFFLFLLTFLLLNLNKWISVHFFRGSSAGICEAPPVHPRLVSYFKKQFCSFSLLLFKCIFKWMTWANMLDCSLLKTKIWWWNTEVVFAVKALNSFAAKACFISYRAGSEHAANTLFLCSLTM